MLAIVQGDITSIEADALVNPWNRNLIPWRLLRPHGVSGRLKQVAGSAVFNEVQKYGKLKPGQAVLTSAGQLSCKAIIHVAAIGLLGRSNLEIISSGTKNALQLAKEQGFKRVAFPLLGAGSGGVAPLEAYRVMKVEFDHFSSDFDSLLLVNYDKTLFEKLR